MKKLLVLALVLCLATSASAILQLSVDGGPNPGQITLAPSDWIELDVTSAPGFIAGQFSIVLSNSQGLLDWGTIQFDPEYEILIPGLGYMADYDMPWRLTPGQDPDPHRVTIDGGNFSGITVSPETILWDLWFHCEEATDVEIYLVSDGLNTESGWIDAGTLLDTLYVTQIIPEPMNIALLGLGGLLLRKRK